MAKNEWVGVVVAVVVLSVAIVLAPPVGAQTNSTNSTTGAFDSSSSGAFGTGSGGTAGSLIRNANITRIKPRDPPNGDVFPRPTFCNTTNQGALAAYDNTTICIIIGGVAKMYFYPTVEVFTLMQIVQGDNLSIFDDPQMWFTAEFSQVSSTVKHRRPQVSGDDSIATVPFWTLIISLSNGVVSSLDWDDGCIGCSGDSCVDDTCAIDGDRCYHGTDCAPKFYVGWFGTDRSGVYLRSAGSRYSRFREYSVSAAFNSAFDTASLDLTGTYDSYTTFQPSCSDGTGTCCTGTDC